MTSPTHNSTLEETNVPLYSHNNGSFMPPGHLHAINLTGLERVLGGYENYICYGICCAGGHKVLPT